ncbi:unnamed protein product [Durusdinium trenchii]|uniref:Uncharacterized protein n=1 Tax=Durusdinium trenchii TaxID=1381693 RepID=A0ABP0LM34_9DINO
MTWSESLSLVLQWSHTGSSPFAQTLAHLDSNLSICFPGRYLGFIPRSPFSVREFVRMGASLFVMSSARFDPLMMVLDFLSLELFLFPQSPSQLDFIALVLSYARADPLLFPQDLLKALLYLLVAW